MNDLLTIDDIAERVGVPRNYVRDELVKRGDFPRPALRLSQRIRKWAAVDFENWLIRHRKQLSK